MNKSLLTFGVGGHAALLDIAQPSFKAFATRHGYDYFEAKQIGHQRPPAWYKVQCLIEALKAYDVAVFIGCDLVIVDGREDLPHDDPDWWQALVIHETPNCGSVPNDDMWVCRKPMIPYLEKIWGMTQYMNHGWWEQAALVDLMGYDPTIERFPTYCKDTENELFKHTRQLPNGWNVHCWDHPQPVHKRIQHATMWPDRAAVMKGWAQQAEGWING
jgi:hypothetical protein